MNVKQTSCFLGRAVAIDNGKTELIITLDVGPRIIGLRPFNGFNMMFEDTNDVINKDCSAYYGEGKKWHIYGGHRLWLSPENLSTYYPDNEKVQYYVENESIIFKPMPWEKVEVQPKLKIEFLADNTISVTHIMRNLGQERELCLWALTVMKSGGEMTFELSKQDTGLLANRNIVLWPYASLNDNRLSLHDDKIVLSSSVEVPEPYKIGAFNELINATYKLKQNGRTQLFIKKVHSEIAASYPDFSCNFESYCNGYIHEIETLSKIAKIPQNGIISHQEIWSISAE